jgi:hypothetical protein
MMSVYRQLMEAEKERYRWNRRYLKASGGSTDTVAYKNLNETYVRKEREIIEDSIAGIPVFRGMMDDRRYLEKIHEEHGLPTVIFTESNKARKKLDSELKDVLGMRPLTPSYIPLPGLFAGIGVLFIADKVWPAVVGGAVGEFLSYWGSIELGNIREKVSRKRMGFIFDIADSVYGESE